MTWEDLIDAFHNYIYDRFGVDLDNYGEDDYDEDYDDEDYDERIIKMTLKEYLIWRYNTKSINVMFKKFKDDEFDSDVCEEYFNNNINEMWIFLKNHMNNLININESYSHNYYWHEFVIDKIEFDVLSDNKLTK